MKEPFPLRVEVPVCAFRPFASREYQDSYPVPPPATVYGMLLSLTGVQRENKAQHLGVELAIAIEGKPEHGKVFRKLRRGTDLEQTRPDYQDLLIDLTLWIWLRQGQDTAKKPLVNTVATALDAKTRNTIHRSGGLSLGESSYLVNSIKTQQPPALLRFVQPDISGYFSLPVWVDHHGNQKTNLKRFTVTKPIDVSQALSSAWVRIEEKQM